MKNRTLWYEVRLRLKDPHCEYGVLDGSHHNSGVCGEPPRRRLE